MVCFDIGMRYNLLEIISDVPTITKRRAYVLCKCDCGNICEIQLSRLRSGHTKSCGCLKKITAITNGSKTSTHKSSETSMYHIWEGMKSRCLYTKNVSYKYYGGRGITVCDRWLHSFENFLEDIGERPDGLSLDRIDVNGNYEPDNCKWSSPKEQRSNRRDYGKISNI